MNRSGQSFINGLIDGSVNRHVILRSYGITLLCLILLLIPSMGWAQENYKEAIPVAEDPEIEKRMLALTEDLRCLVCQNESIADSRADFSNDMRRIIREQIKAGKTDAEIVEFLVDRYGDFVLYNPPMKATTVMLWFGPFIFLIFGSWFLVKYLKGRRLQVEEVNLTEEDQKKAAVLLDEKDVKMSESRQEKTEVSMSENKGNNV